MDMPLNLNDFEQAARERLPLMIYDYFAGGAGDEITVRDNELAWRGWRLRPRVLVDVSQRDLSTTVLGQPVSLPILIAPCGLSGMAHPDGECAVTRAAAAAGTIHIVSTVATRSLEEVAEACEGPRWFQLYCYRDREITRALI